MSNRKRDHQRSNRRQRQIQAIQEAEPVERPAVFVSEAEFREACKQAGNSPGEIEFRVTLAKEVGSAFLVGDRMMGIKT